ncbi:serine acetyltransferase [Planococcus sp. MERTA32b]|nr:serine acetyltransferase [Planococcus sp. MER TA 32b]
MIRNKQDYLFYLRADLLANNMEEWRWHHHYTKPVRSYQRLLRKVEYYKNCKKGLFGRLYLWFLKYCFYKKSVELGLQIKPNVFGPGLGLPHYGSIVVSSRAKIGKNCRIHSSTNIGESDGRAPIIGDNLYMGPGAKIAGGIQIGDNVAIGANAVVFKDVQSNVTIGGIPGKVVSEKGSKHLVIDGYGQALAEMEQVMKKETSYG